jgi:hypothetical protein
MTTFRTNPIHFPHRHLREVLYMEHFFDQPSLLHSPWHSVTPSTSPTSPTFPPTFPAPAVHQVVPTAHAPVHPHHCATSLPSMSSVGYTNIITITYATPEHIIGTRTYRHQF